MQEIGMNFKHWHYWLPVKRWDTLFLNSSKSQTCLKFMKLGMLSWNGTRHAVVFLCPFLEKAHLNNNKQRHFETNSCHSNIANVLDRTPVCTLTASLVSQGKMCREGFVQLFIANVLDRTHLCKVRAMVFCSKPRENSPRRICASLQRKRFRLNKVCKARLRR